MEKIKELIKKNKKIVITSVLLLALISVFGYKVHQERANKEKLANAIEYLNSTYNSKKDLVEFIAVEGRTDLIIQTFSMDDMYKDEMANDIVYSSYYEYYWEEILETDIELNDRMNDRLVEEDYEGITVISYIVDENDEVVAIVYDGVVYYDYLEEIDRHEKLENKFDIEIELEELE